MLAVVLCVRLQALVFLRKGLTALSRNEASQSASSSENGEEPAEEEGAGAGEGGETPESRRERADLAAMLAMTLHNAAVQHEHLEQWKHALAAYQCAANCAMECLGTEHSITISLTTACKDATRTIARKTGIVRQHGSSRSTVVRAASPPAHGGGAGRRSGAGGAAARQRMQSMG
jgi:hypothetical protein